MKLQASLKKEYKSLKKQLMHLWEQNPHGDPIIADFSKVKVDIELQSFHLPINVGQKKIGFMYFDPIVIQTTGEFVDQTMSLALKPPRWSKNQEPIIVKMIIRVGKNVYGFEGKYSFTKSSVRKTKSFQQL